MSGDEFARAIHEAHTAAMYSLRDIAGGDKGTVSADDCPVCSCHGICGDRMEGPVGGGAPIICILTAGHRGWHESDEHTRWSLR